MAFLHFAYSQGNLVNVFMASYLSKSVKLIKMAKLNSENNGPILLCAVKNDLERVQLQLEHHRKIGIKHFAYIDNMSNDNTFEWLNEQNDVSLFIVEEIFNVTKKNAWRKQVMDFLGYDKWYLILDSDELFVYPGIETLPINVYIDFCERNNVRNVLSPMIDMYSRSELFGKYKDTSKITDNYCYFDVDTYTISNGRILGGPRSRLFSTEEKHFSPLLKKYALNKVSDSILIGTHENYPPKKLESDGAIAFILHYKFLPEDKLKYRNNVASQLYWNKSSEYKKYLTNLNQNPELTFFYPGSQKLNDSKDLMKINIIDKYFFEMFFKWAGLKNS